MNYGSGAKPAMAVASYNVELRRCGGTIFQVSVDHAGGHKAPCSVFPVKTFASLESMTFSTSATVHRIKYSFGKMRYFPDVGVVEAM